MFNTSVIRKCKAWLRGIVRHRKPTASGFKCSEENTFLNGLKLSFGVSRGS